MLGMTTVIRPYKGVSATERRAERRDRLIDALFEVVSSDGVLGVTVDKVCAVAGLSKRYFYEGFSDLDALMLAAADTLYDRLFARMSEAAASNTDEVERIRAVVSSVIADLAADLRASRLYAESPGQPTLRARREQAVDTFTAFIGEQVLQLPDDGTGDLRIRLIVSGATDVITGFLAGTIDTDQAGVVEAVVSIAAALRPDQA